MHIIAKKTFSLSDYRVYSTIFQRDMTTLEGEGARFIDKFNGDGFNLSKFKLKMELAFMDLWNKSEGAPSSNIDPKMKKEYQRHINNAIFIITLNLMDN